MSISSQVDKSGPVLLTALPQVVPTVFPFQSGSDIVAYDIGSVGTPIDPPTTLTLGSDYTVTGGGYNALNEMQVGSITIMSGGVGTVAVGHQIVVARAVPINQTSSFVTTGPLTLQLIEQALDKTATIDQQLNDQGTRSLRFEESEFLDGTMYKSLRAGNVVGFDSNGNLTYYAFVSGTVSPQSVQGSQRQVLVNGTYGIPTTGAIILTLPQGVATDSAPQFVRLSINGTSLANTDITVNRSVPGVTAQASIVVAGNLTAAYDLHPNAFRDITMFTPTVAADGYCSYDAQTIMAGTVALNHYRGYQCRTAYTGTGVIGEISGFMTANFGLNGLGTATFMRGFYVSQPTITGGGTVGQFDGIYMDALTNPTGLVNGIYLAGPNNIFMAGGQICTSALLAPTTTTSRLDIVFDQGTQVGANIKNKNVTNTGTYVNFYNSSTVVQGSITQTNSTTTAFNTSSDLRLKENWRDMADSGNILDALRPRVFDWKWGGKDFHGFLAQELNDVFPEAVLRGTDEINANGDLVHPWGVDFGKLVPVLTAEIKSLRTRMRSLESVVQP